jgi:hypothetical protein
MMGTTRFEEIVGIGVLSALAGIILVWTGFVMLSKWSTMGVMSAATVG